MTLDFSRWRITGTRTPVARINVTYVIGLDDLVTAATWITSDALDNAGYDAYENEPTPAVMASVARATLTRASVEKRLRRELATYGEFRLDADPAEYLVSARWEDPLTEAVRPLVMFLFPDAVPEEE